MAAPEITLDVARLIIAEHAPAWEEYPIRAIRSSGTDNALFMLGDDHVLRLPLRPEAVTYLEKELDWMHRFDRLPLAVPPVVHSGRAWIGFDTVFGIFGWLQGQIAGPDRIADPSRAAQALARFLAALSHVDTTGAPRAGAPNNDRGIALPLLTDGVEASVALMSDEIDARAARTLWDRACAAPAADYSSWFHGDLKSDNMIARDGGLVGVIDWGLSAVGDPAVDWSAAWSWVDPSDRATFMDTVETDDDGWRRAEGWALRNAVIALSHYRGRSHEALCAQCRRTLRRLGLLL